MIRVYIGQDGSASGFGVLPLVEVISESDENLMRFRYNNSTRFYIEINKYVLGSYLVLFNGFYFWCVFE